MAKSIKTETRRRLISFIIASVTLFMGGMVYVLFRPMSLLMFEWFDSVGLLRFIWRMRIDTTLLLPNWIEYSLPDGLWIFSYSLFIGCIWNFRLNKSFPFLLLLPLISVIDEILQMFHVVPGTFDVWDICAYILASVLGIGYILLMNKKIVLYEK